MKPEQAVFVQPTFTVTITSTVNATGTPVWVGFVPAR